MELKVEIDNKSGFCYGVVRAIEEAENVLSKESELFSLGSIVHNNSELKRLENKGLGVINYKDLESLKSGIVLFRAHGEPPQSYETAKKNNLKIIDCTCPVVLKLQSKVRVAYAKMKETGGSVVIFGKEGHAEVNGLAGQVNGDVIIIHSEKDLNKIDFTKPINLFSQTTKDTDEYQKLCESIKERIVTDGGPSDKFKAFNTICGQVSSRQPHLKEFAKNHDVIIFVSGKESSNGKVLFDLCKSVNSRTYNVEDSSQIEKGWFEQGNKVGICGATSTPKWLLDEVAEYISKL
jgi:4-hydroxy-3-methylbut-2-enyl diphosphate reductase